LKKGKRFFISLIIRRFWRQMPMKARLQEMGVYSSVIILPKNMPPAKDQALASSLILNMTRKAGDVDAEKL
jgi:hypothetical protein